MRWQKQGIWVLALLVCAVVCLSPLTKSIPVAQAAIVGDIDQNGERTMRDALTLYSYVSGNDVILTVAQLKCADVNDDGGVSMKDALMLYQLVSGVDLNTTTATKTTASTAIIATTTTTTTTATASTVGTYPVPTQPTAVKGIDVSYAQGEIDWTALKKSGEIEFAILRCGYGQDEPGQDDVRWDEYAAACEENDIPYGAYFFCYARNEQEARGEALHALRLLKGKNLSLPVFLDMEDSNWQGVLTPAEYAAIATVFCETLRAEGYQVGVYSNLYWWRERLTDPCFDRWYRWVAQYNTACDYQGVYHLWQNSENGAATGIKGRVDTDWCYVDPRTVW